NRATQPGRLSVPVVSASIALAEVIPLFAISPLLLIKNDQGECQGYIAVSDVLHAMMHAHRLIEAYFETTLETAGSALTLIN
ncbi:hypothetical protein SB781_38425, partial [Paraburkholderia sp. SIMBA_061]